MEPGLADAGGKPTSRPHPSWRGRVTAPRRDSVHVPRTQKPTNEVSFPSFLSASDYQKQELSRGPCLAQSVGPRGCGPPGYLLHRALGDSTCSRQGWSHCWPCTASSGSFFLLRKPQRHCRIKLYLESRLARWSRES